MNNKLGVVGTVAVVALAIGGGVFAIYTTDRNDSQKSANTKTTDKTESNDSNKYASLTGEAFDEAFIADMLAHHEGAVNMAEQAQAVTAHEEIRTLAGNIVSSQSKEMMDMRAWQKKWGYEVTNSGGHMSHGGQGMEMASDMIEMMERLQGIKGEAYDKEFLTQMILHHEQAVEMAQYADANAKHEEVRNLARIIIAAQNTEINQMEQWQKEWGY